MVRNPFGQSYDMAQGFETMIDTQKGVIQAINDLRPVLVAALDQQRKFGTDPASVSAADQVLRGSRGGGDPLAGQTTSQNQGGDRRTSVESARNSALAGILGLTQPLAGPAAPGGRWGGGQGGWGAGSGARRAGGESDDFSGGSGGGYGSGGAGSGGGGPYGGGGSNGGGGVPSGANGAGDGGGPGGGGSGAGGGGNGGGGGRGGGPGGGGDQRVANGLKGLVQTVVPGGRAITGLYDEYMRQRAKNDYYRNIEGGTQVNAFGERINEFGYGLSSLGVLSNEQASEAFKGVTRMGYTDRSDGTGLAGRSRADVLDFVKEGVASRGQSVDEGLEQASVASKSASVNLTAFSKALEAVSETAGKAGVNTMMARAQMTQFIDMGIKANMGGGAVGFAQTITQTNASYGKSFFSSTDASPMFSQGNAYRVASLNGMTIGHLNRLQRTDPVAAARAYGVLGNQAMQSGVVTQQMHDWITSHLEDMGRQGQDPRSDEGAMQTLIQQFLDQFEDGMNPDVFVRVLSTQAGETFGNVEEAVRWLIQNIGGNTMAATAAKTQAANAQTGLSGKQADGTVNAGLVMNSDTTQKYVEDVNGGHMESVQGDPGSGTDASNWSNALNSKTTHDTGFLGLRTDQARAVQTYEGNASKTGKRDPLLEQLLSDDAFQGDQGDKTKVKVLTKDGARVVPLSVAMQYFPEQIAEGQATFMNGKYAGGTIQTVTGQQRQGNEWMDERSKQGGNADGFQTQAQWAKDNPDDAQALNGGGGGTLDLTPAAKQLVQLMQNGGANSTGMPINPTVNGDGSKYR